ncbi:MAG: undecaprenyl-diphosphate phosphatase [Nanoarchaeota archaeon]|nr:undecaprenyl-diphosphate phosphatase [Nanoarchaeota archaeon]
MVVSFDLVSALILAVVQGITEWLPVSSSGHLVVAQKLLGFDGGLKFDIALHFGTLMAAFVYFGGDIVEITRELLAGRWRSGQGRLGLVLVVATIPAAICGLIFKSVVESAFYSLGVVALGFCITGVCLIIASMDFGIKKKINSLNELSYKDSFTIGLSQVFALLPGISRSGMTISSGLLAGLDEKQALRFSFLMSIPIIFGANIVTIGNSRLPPDWIWATLTSFIVGLVALHVLINYVLSSKKNLLWFGLYAVLLGISLEIWVLFF